MNLFTVTTVLTCLLVLTGHGAFAGNENLIPDLPGNIMVIALAGTLLPFLGIGMVVFLILYFRSRDRNRKYELLEKAIESGREIPVNFFDEVKKNNPKNKLESAFVFMGVGIGIALFGGLASSLIWFAVPAGAIPFLIGTGKLLAFLIEKRQQAEVRPENE